MSDDEVRDGRPRPANLDALSIDELEARVATLQAEIAACERAIAQKRQVRNAADAFFSPKE